MKYIIDLNRRAIDLIETYAQIILSKILTPFATGYVDLQSPSGAGICFVAYDHNGDVYASDEARMLGQMGDRTFRMGNVHKNSYEDIFSGPVIRELVESSCVECLPGCSECAFQTYCGADPILNYVTQGDLYGHRNTNEFCQKNKAIITLLFDYLRNGDDFTRRLLIGWATGVNHAIDKQNG
jgi:uncharacterized protein